jgi:hypothetical protein
MNRESIFKIGLLNIIISGFFSVGLAQFVAPYTDIMDQVYIFDDGNTRLLEPLPLKEYKVGKMLCCILLLKVDCELIMRAKNTI